MISCSSNQRASNNKEATIKYSSFLVNPSSGHVSWSCVIDGQPVLGGKVSSYFGSEGYKSSEAHIVEVDQGKE